MDNWDDIRYFLQVAKSGNVTNASVVLGVNHSTVSRRIRTLEQNLGVLLFHRQPGGYELTDAGNAIREIAEDMEGNSHKIARQLFAHDSRIEGPVNLTLPHDLLDFCIMDDLFRFKQKFPEVTLNLEVAKGLKNLAVREADLAIRLTPAPPEYLIGSEICKIQHGIYAPHDFDIKDKVKLILWYDELEKPQWAKKYFPEAQISMRVDDCYSMYSAVKMGLGVARIPCYLPDLIASPEVKRLNFEVARSSWGVWVLSHVDLRNNLRIKRCREFFREALRNKKPWFEGERSSFLDL